MVDPASISPPAPVDKGDRIVDVPPTVRESDTAGDYPAKQKTRADFRPDEFERVLGQHGKFVTWRKALLCPCENRETGQPQVDCTDCDGSGYVYVDPLNVQALMLMFDKNTRIYEKFGMWLEGNVMVTVRPEYRLGFRDSIEMRDSVMSFNELLRKGNRRGRRSKLPDNNDSARYRITQVTRLAYHTGDTFTLLEAGYHFEVSDEGWIHWLAPGRSAVPDGTTYSVLYDFHPVFQIISHPHSTRDDVIGTKRPKDTVTALPIQAAARLDYLIDINTAAVPAAG